MIMNKTELLLNEGCIFYEPKQCISRKSHKETNARVLQKFRE